LQSRDGSIFLTIKPSTKYWTVDTVQHSIMVNITWRRFDQSATKSIDRLTDVNVCKRQRRQASCSINEVQQTSKARPPAVLIANSHRQKPTRQKCLVALRRAVWTGFKSCASESTLNAVAFTSRSSVNLSANTLFRCRRCREHENGRTKCDAFWDTRPVRTAANCSRIYDHIACKSHRGALSTERWLQSIRKVVPWDTGNTTAESKDLLTARKLSWTNSSSLHTCIPMECLQQTRVQSAGWGRKLRQLSMAY